MRIPPVFEIQKYMNLPRWFENKNLLGCNHHLRKCHKHSVAAIPQLCECRPQFVLQRYMHLVVGKYKENKWKENSMVWKQQYFLTYQYWKHIFNVENSLPETTFMVNFGALEPFGLANCWQGTFPGNRYFRCSGSNFTNLCGYWYDSRSCQDDSLKFENANFSHTKN